MKRPPVSKAWSTLPRSRRSGSSDGPAGASPRVTARLTIMPLAGGWRMHPFPAGCTEIGPVMKKLRETLTGIQSGAVEDKHNWVYTVA